MQVLAAKAIVPSLLGKRQNRRACSRSAESPATASSQRTGGYPQANLQATRTDAVPSTTQCSRRDLLAAGLALSVPLVIAPGRADANTETAIVADTAGKFSVTVPKDWESGTGEIPGGQGTRTVYAWHAPGDRSISVSVVSSIVSVEYPTLGSFGTAYGFALGNVTRLDRRTRKKGKQIADLVDAAERGGAYYYEYTVQQPDEGIYRHVYEKVTLKFDGIYNRLWTITGVYLDEDKEVADAVIKSAVNSFNLA